MRIGWVVSIVFVLLSANGAWGEISYREYRAIKRIGDRILSQYPPSEYLYVGLGASPTGLIAYLELVQGSRAVAQVPLSRGMALQRAYSLDSRRAHIIDQVLDEHFRRFLPDSLLGGKKLLLIDFSIMGITLPFAGERLQEAMQRRGNSVEIQMLSLYRNPEVVEKLNHRGIDSYRLSAYAHDLFMSQRFDRYRLYEKFDASNLDSLRSYRSPERQAAEIRFSDFIESQRKGHFAPAHYSFLLRELQTWMERDFSSRHFYFAPRFQPISNRCSEVFVY